MINVNTTMTTLSIMQEYPDSLWMYSHEHLHKKIEFLLGAISWHGRRRAVRRLFAAPRSIQVSVGLIRCSKSDKMHIAQYNTGIISPGCRASLQEDRLVGTAG